MNVHYHFARLHVLNPKIARQVWIKNCGLLEDTLNITDDFKLILYRTDFIYNIFI